MPEALHPLVFGHTPDVTGLRLIEAGDADHPQPRLLVGVQPEAGGLAIVAVHLDSASRPPEAQATVERNAAWDAIGSVKGVAVVSSQSGSAVSALVWQMAGHADHARVNRRNGFGVFGAPHFIKRDGGPLVPITSVALGRSGSRLVLFPPEPDGGYGAFRELPTPQPGELLDARIVHWGAGYLLVTKTTLPGPGRPERADPDSETILPGRIDCVRLNDALLANGTPWQPFPAQPVFQFDVDTNGDGVAILATVATGAVLSTATRASARAARVDFRSASPLTSPAVLAVGTTLHLALLDAAGGPGAAILVAQVPAGGP